ncbi:L-asparaginase II [Polychaeton citri CBS 116435]|uniref:L-asparaginase II n=1 Tax=Polychaeton citri CBS 116435 TaxID=1314669 RepID=A0A9P4QEV2_9PEZI|nr:L-asparaginase II [Polychaeton citri CBS 116435]
MLAKSGVKESDMRCGGHPAISEAVNRKWIKEDFVPTAIYSNCSGKHIGMLTGARAIGADVADYHQPSSPMQLRVKRAVEELSGLSKDEIRWSIDGCNLPAPAFSLRNLGLMYAHLAAAADITERNSTVTDRENNVARIFRAMTMHPEMVGGEGRFCTILMKTYQGALLGKLGADACYGIGVRASEQTRALGAEGAIGIGVKVEDGSIDILYSAVAEVLDQLQIGTDETRDKLKTFQCLKRFNTVGVEVGQLSHHFDVRRARPV